MRARRACGGAVAFAAALMLCGAAPPATAAPYIAVACAEPSGLLTLHDHVIRPTDGWMPDGLVAPGVDSCHEGREGRGLYAASGGTFSGYRFDAPPGTALIDAWMYFQAWLPPTTNAARPAFAVEARHGARWTAVLPGRHGMVGSASGLYGWAHAALGRTAALRVGVGCRPQPCAGSAPPRAEVRSVGVAIDDREPPALDPLESSLLDSGPRQGPYRLRFGATDRESGVASVRVTLGGREAGVWRGDGHCRRLLDWLVAGVPHYDARVPCPPAAERTAVIDTAALPDGPHDLSVRAEDAAGNADTAGARVVLDNHPPAAGAVRLRGRAALGERLEAEPSGFEGQQPRVEFVWQRCAVDGEGCVDAGYEREYVVGPLDGGRRLRARITATDGGGSAHALSALSDVVPAPAPAVAPQPTAAPAPRLTVVAPAPVVGRGRLNAWLDGPRGATRTLHVRRGTRVRIRGRLTDATGRPISGAALGLVEYVHGVPRRASGTTTRRDGRFTTFTRLGPGRALRFIHRGTGGVVRSPILRLVLRR